MNKDDEKLLTECGWDVTCYSPFEIQNVDSGACADGEAADLILEGIKLRDRLSRIQTEFAKMRYVNTDGALTALEDAIMGEPEVGDSVVVSHGQWGELVEIANGKGFNFHPYVVKITHPTLGDVSDVEQFQRHQLRVRHE